MMRDRGTKRRQAQDSIPSGEVRDSQENPKSIEASLRWPCRERRWRGEFTANQSNHPKYLIVFTIKYNQIGCNRLKIRASRFGSRNPSPRCIASRSHDGVISPTEFGPTAVLFPCDTQILFHLFAFNRVLRLL